MYTILQRLCQNMYFRLKMVNSTVEEGTVKVKVNNQFDNTPYTVELALNTKLEELKRQFIESFGIPKDKHLCVKTQDDVIGNNN